MDTFADKVARTVAQLRRGDYHAMGAEIARRRRQWLEHVLPGKAGCEGYSPRQAYELLFFEQMGLEPSELPVVSESADEIVWLSYNRCPLLEACRALGLDTRKVCRAVNEKATQAFLSWIDPRLRFSRSYVEIRPHAAYCRESIVRIDLEAYMREALHEARGCREGGSRANGAIIVLGERIIARAHDAPSVAAGPSWHAEAAAIAEAAIAAGDADLCGAILFSTCEPCLACMTLATRANLTTIAYGAPREDGHRAGEVAAGLPDGIEVIAGVLRDDCLALQGRH